MPKRATSVSKQPTQLNERELIIFTRKLCGEVEGAMWQSEGEELARSKSAPR